MSKEPSVARKVFLSFHYDVDVLRVSQVKQMGSLEGQPVLEANGWEQVRRQTEDAIKRWINDNMRDKECVVALIGSQTAGRKWVKYEIEKGWNDGKGVLGIETEPYDVPLMVVRGFASETYLYQAAQTIRTVGKPAFLYVLTDLDPSGLSIADTIETRIRGFIPDADVTVRRIAVTPEQVQQWKLPTRPTKKTDSRSKTFAGESVELDAIPPTTLRTLVREAIEQHIDSAQLVATKRTERLERASLYDILDMIGGAE
jgi:hypothetical protein